MKTPPHEIFYSFLAGCYSIVDISKNAIKEGDPTIVHSADFTLNNGCNGSMNAKTTNNVRMYGYPVEWLSENRRDEKSFKELLQIIKGLGVDFVFQFMGESATMKKHFLTINRYQLYNLKLHGPTKANQIVYENNWAFFYFKNDATGVFNYYAHCIARCISNIQYRVLFEDTADLVKEGMDPFEAFQMAHYAYTLPYNYSRGFLPLVIGGNAVAMLTLKEFAEKCQTQSSLNTIFTNAEKVVNVTYKEIHELFLKKDYEQIRKLIG